MTSSDIRWKQRFSNFEKAMNQLERFVTHTDLNEMEEQGMIQAFEYTYELAWNVMKDFYESQGETLMQGSRDAIRMAINRGLIAEGEIWMDMIQSRIATAHTYNQATAKDIIRKLRKDYVRLFAALRNEMKTRL